MAAAKSCSKGSSALPATFSTLRMESRAAYVSWRIQKVGTLGLGWVNKGSLMAVSVCATLKTFIEAHLAPYKELGEPVQTSHSFHHLSTLDESVAPIPDRNTLFTKYVCLGNLIHQC